jgi:microcystin-dependent protein
MTHYVGDVFLWTKNWDGSGIQNCVKCDGSVYSVEDFSGLYSVLDN